MAIEVFKQFHYLVHSGNIESIVARGILSHTEVMRSAITPVDISDPDVQRWRKRPEPVHGRPIHDYVPLYLNPRNPMLYRHRALQRDLLILVVSRSVLRDSEHLFSDGNAASRATRFSRCASVLDRSADVLTAPSWNNFDDGGRRRCAEVLVHRRVDPRHILRVVCSNNWRARQLKLDHGLEPVVDTSFYF